MYETVMLALLIGNGIIAAGVLASYLFDRIGVLFFRSFFNFPVLGQFRTIRSFAFKYLLPNF